MCTRNITVKIRHSKDTSVDKMSENDAKTNRTYYCCTTLKVQVCFCVEGHICMMKSGTTFFHNRKATLSWLHVSFHKLGCSLKFNGNVQVFELSKGNKAITDQQ